MTPDTRSSVDPFTIAGITFHCWATDNGHRYEWRSDHLKSGRVSGSPLCWASISNRSLGKSFHNLKAAMFAAVTASRSEWRRAA